MFYKTKQKLKSSAINNHLYRQNKKQLILNFRKQAIDGHIKRINSCFNYFYLPLLAIIPYNTILLKLANYVINKCLLFELLIKFKSYQQIYYYVQHDKYNKRGN